MKAIVQGRLILPDENDEFIVDDDKALIYDEQGIQDIVDPMTYNQKYGSSIPMDDVIDADGAYVSAGFLNVHIHGCGGADTMDDDADALTTIRKKQA